MNIAIFFFIIMILFGLLPVLTLISLIISKPLYKGYLKSQNIEMSTSDDFDYEMKFLNFALKPVTLIGKAVDFVLFKVGLVVGNLVK